MEEMIKNPYALFAENQETYEEAVKKVPMRANHSTYQTFPYGFRRNLYCAYPSLGTSRATRRFLQIRT